MMAPTTPPSTFGGRPFSLIDASLNVLLYAIPILHVFLSPYTKVEESFTLHAVHDFMLYGWRPTAENLSKVCTESTSPAKLSSPQEARRPNSVRSFIY
jgi:hypothetical protein